MVKTTIASNNKDFRAVYGSMERSEIGLSGHNFWMEVRVARAADVATDLCPFGTFETTRLRRDYERRSRNANGMIIVG